MYLTYSNMLYSMVNIIGYTRYLYIGVLSLNFTDSQKHFRKKDKNKCPISIYLYKDLSKKNAFFVLQHNGVILILCFPCPYQNILGDK